LIDCCRGGTNLQTTRLTPDEEEQMKYLKMVSLAAVAVAVLLAVAGAGTAGATVLCKEDKNPCGSDYAAGTQIAAKLPAGVSMLWWKFGEVADTCTAATMVGKTSTTGGSTSAVVAPLSALTWTGCTTARETIKPGTLEIDYVSGGGAVVATLKLKGAEWKEGSCTYGFSGIIDLGRLKKSETLTSGATMEVNALFPRLAGVFPCPETIKWEARYLVTAPVPLYVSAS
jgi:hypothetical protein